MSELRALAFRTWMWLRSVARMVAWKLGPWDWWWRSIFALIPLGLVGEWSSPGPAVQLDYFSVTATVLPVLVVGGIAAELTSGDGRYAKPGRGQRGWVNRRLAFIAVVIGETSAMVAVAGAYRNVLLFSGTAVGFLGVLDPLVTRLLYEADAGRAG